MTLEVVAHQGRALIGSRWAAERIARHANDDESAIWHRFQLFAKERRLRSGDPGMRHCLRGGLIVASDAAPDELNPWRDDQIVVVERPSAGQPDLLAGWIDRSGRVMHDIDAGRLHLAIVKR